jgi:hypothetical protein
MQSTILKTSTWLDARLAAALLGGQTTSPTDAEYAPGTSQLHDRRRRARSAGRRGTDRDNDLAAAHAERLGNHRGQPATVQAASAPGSVSGLFLVNVIVPGGLTAGNVPLVVTVGTASGQSGVTAGSEIAEFAELYLSP